MWNHHDRWGGVLPFQFGSLCPVIWHFRAKRFAWSHLFFVYIGSLYIQVWSSAVDDHLLSVCLYLQPRCTLFFIPFLILSQRPWEDCVYQEKIMSQNVAVATEKEFWKNFTLVSCDLKGLNKTTSCCCLNKPHFIHMIHFCVTLLCWFKVARGQVDRGWCHMLALQWSSSSMWVWRWWNYDHASLTERLFENARTKCNKTYTYSALHMCTHT